MASANTAASLPMKSLLRHVVLLLAFADRGNRGFREGLDFGRIEPHRAGAFHGRHHPVENRLHDEDLLFGDAEQIVVVRTAFDDAACGAVEIGGFIDDDGRIARPGDDRPLGLLHGRLGDARPAGDDEQD